GAPTDLAASLNEFGAMGVNHIQLRFRSRSLDELLDQMAAFHRDVAPHLGR
ncbi:MAG TPA: LLM class F420-dependent oxidoreductase, partial [Acidimicrobiia bacterium]|nr:LLM class F420-dependent oxidoreductase [Acidimicrobiia bacterium]